MAVGGPEADAAAAAGALEGLLTSLETEMPAGGATARIADCERALRLFDRLGRPDPLRRAAIELILGTSLWTLAAGGDAVARDKAVAAFERGTGLVAPDAAGGSLWLALTLHLGAAYLQRGASDDDGGGRIEKALDAYDAVVRALARDGPSAAWAEAHANLAYCYLHRIAGDRAENLFRATVSGQLAKRFYDPEQFRHERATVLLTLGSAQRLSIRGSRASNVEDALASHTEAVNLFSREAEPGDWAKAATSLANDYADRIVGERAANIEQAGIALNRALGAFADTHDRAAWAMTMTNYAATLLDRLVGDRAQNVEDALDATRGASENASDIPAILARAAFYRGDALVRRIRGDRSQNVEDAIAAYTSALETFTRASYPVMWAATQVRLGSTHAARVAGDPAQNLATAIERMSDALAVFTRDAFPLEWARASCALAELALRSPAPADPAADGEALERYRGAVATFVGAGMAADILRAARGYADALADRGRFADSTVPYRYALSAAEDLYRSSLSRAGKEAELETSSGLPHRAAFALAQSGDVRFAAIVLERNRARWINDALERDRFAIERLRSANPQLVDAFDRAAAAVANLEAVEAARTTRGEAADSSGIDPGWSREMAAAKRGLAEIATTIATTPGFEEAFRFPTFEDLAAAVVVAQPLVFLTATPLGGLALVLARGDAGDGAAVDVTTVPLPSLTSAWLADLADRWLGAPGDAARAQAAWVATVDDVAQRMWEPLMGPLVAHLRALGAGGASFVPCGALSFLPLHAAWTADASGARTYACDGLAFSYTASARALVRARRVANDGAGTAGDALQSPAASVLAVDEPWPVRAAPLDDAEAEATAVASTFATSRVLRREAATRAAVLAALGSFDVAHFACHGFSRLNAPRQSGIVMANDEFVTVADLFALDLRRARLVTLSACETAIVGSALPDESISLAEAFVRAGYSGAIASLWPVPDLATAMLSARFYERLRHGGDASAVRTPAEVLREAQAWLRDSTNGEKAAYFGSFLPEVALDRSGIGRMSPESAGTFYRALAFDDPVARAHASPFYWAAFSYVGV